MDDYVGPLQHVSLEKNKTLWELRYESLAKIKRKCIEWTEVILKYRILKIKGTPC